MRHHFYSIYRRTAGIVSQLLIDSLSNVFSAEVLSFVGWFPRAHGRYLRVAFALFVNIVMLLKNGSRMDPVNVSESTLVSFNDHETLRDVSKE